MKLKLFISIFLILIIVTSYSQNVIVKGKSEEYANQTLRLMKYSDMITFTQEEIASTKVDKDGNFEFNFLLKETTFCFINLDILKGFIVIEPSAEYTISLPKKTTKTSEEELNPYYKPQEFYFTIDTTDKGELNYNLRKFDSLYNSALLQIFKTSYAKYKKSKVDSLVFTIDSLFLDIDNQYFNNYKEYRYASIRKSAYLRDKEIAIKKYFIDKEILYNNPAYMDLFSDIFDKIFSTSSYLADWDIIRLSIAKESFNGIDKALSTKDLFSDKDFRHLVIIKGLFDLYYSNSADKENILAVLDSMQSFAGKENKVIINNFWKSATSLLENYKVPVFELPDKDNNLVNLNDFEGSFVYLSFFHPDSYVCKKQVEALEKLYSYNADLLKIVTIFVADSPQKMNDFITENKCNWTFLYYNKDIQLLKDYNILVYPTYLLINPEGKLVKNSASSPEEEFEREYNSYYLDWKKEQVKKTKEGKTLGND